MGYAYIDSTSIDNESPYYVDWERTKLGKLEAREPQLTQTAGGVYTVYPLVTAVKERRGSVAISAQCVDYLEKMKLESVALQLLYGARKIHRGSRYLNVYFLGGESLEETKTAPKLAAVSSDFIAADPFWYLNQPLRGIAVPVNVGDEWGLYDDNAVPSILPAYVFTSNSFTLNNWGTAFTFGAGTITGGPNNTTVYLKGPAGSNYRVPVALNGSGAGTFLATAELRLDPGNNAIRVEQSDGTLQTVGGSFSISFGDTYMRYH